MDDWLFALPKIIAFILVMLFLISIGPVGWIIAFIYVAALSKK